MIQPKLKTVCPATHILVPTTPPQLTELPELLVRADSMTSQMTSTARKVDFSEGGVSLLGLGFRQARRLWEAVLWPLSQ